MFFSTPPRQILPFFNRYYFKFTQKITHKALLINNMQSNGDAYKNEWNRCQKTKKERRKFR